MKALWTYLSTQYGVWGMYWFVGAVGMRLLGGSFITVYERLATAIVNSDLPSGWRLEEHLRAWYGLAPDCCDMVDLGDGELVCDHTCVCETCAAQEAEYALQRMITEANEFYYRNAVVRRED